MPGSFGRSHEGKIKVVLLATVKVMNSSDFLISPRHMGFR
jgi:hypothetical protein